MAAYKIIDLYNQLHEIASDGFEYVEISQLEADEDFPESLSFCAVETYYSGVDDYDRVDSCELPEDYDVADCSIFNPVPFSVADFELIKSSLNDSVAYCKKQLDSVTISADERSSITQKLKSYEALRNTFVSKKRGF